MESTIQVCETKKSQSCSSQGKQLQLNLSIKTAGLITNRRRLTFSMWNPESKWKGYIFIKMCVGRACKTSPCLLKKRQNLGVDVVSSSSMETSYWLPQIVCLNEATPGSTWQGTATNLQGHSFVVLTHHIPHSIHLIYFPVKQCVNTFTHETNYDRIKASLAPF